MKRLILIICLILFQFALTPVSAQTNEPRIAVSEQKIAQTITVKVNGLVCSFCAQGIKKRFMRLPVVSSVQVSLGKKRVVIELKPDAILSDKLISDTVREAGYTPVEIKR